MCLMFSENRYLRRCNIGMRIKREVSNSTNSKSYLWSMKLRSNNGVHFNTDFGKQEIENFIHIFGKF